ncbi:MAG: peptidase [Flavobacteriales bacterium]|nr:MAG: peptidase [Flavobacteriales bacterium]
MAQQYEQPQLDIKKLTPIIVIVGIILFLFIFGSKMTITIQPGHAGIIFKQFGEGLDKEKVYYEGFQFIAPWNDMIVYEIRQREVLESMAALSADQLSITMDLTVLYHPVADKIGYLHDKNGPTYEKKIIKPGIRSALREVIARHNPEEINTTKRREVKEQITEALKLILAKNYLELEDVLIRNILLPQTLMDAINRKLKEEQAALEYEFKLERARKEAERKMIEAEGVRKFQEIVNQSITEKLLRWKGIEATLELANSENAKVVVVGGGKDGLPLILGGN